MGIIAVVGYGRLLLGTHLVTPTTVYLLGCLLALPLLVAVSSLTEKILQPHQFLQGRLLEVLRIFLLATTLFAAVMTASSGMMVGLVMYLYL